MAKRARPLTLEKKKKKANKKESTNDKLFL